MDSASAALVLSSGRGLTRRLVPCRGLIDRFTLWLPLTSSTSSDIDEEIIQTATNVDIDVSGVDSMHDRKDNVR